MSDTNQLHETFNMWVSAWDLVVGELHFNCVLK